MLAQLERQVNSQRRFAANASHELRTPLAITQSLLEVARADPEQNPAQVYEQLQTVNNRAIDLTEALLRLSQAERALRETEPADLSLLAEDAVETLLPLADQRGIDLSTDGETTIATGSLPLLLQLVTNLVHNGIVHNTTRTAGAQNLKPFVSVHTSQTADRATLRVENSGPIIPASVLTTLTEPFQRGAARIQRDHTGAGLGLAIVDAIVRAHDGTLLLEVRQEGGLTVTVTLPRTSRT